MKWSYLYDMKHKKLPNKYIRGEIMNLAENSITGANIEHREGNYRFGKHLHTSIEIYLIDQGSCLMDIGNQQFSFSEGDFILILPHVVHSFFTEEEGEGCQFRHIHVKPDLFSRILISKEPEHPLNLLNALQFSCNSFYCSKTDGIISGCVDEIIEVYEKEDSVLKLSYMNNLLIRLFFYVIKISEEKLASRTKMQNHYVSFALKYIEENYMHKIRQTEIADLLHISVRYLSKLFNEYMGMTFSKYINVFRINQAILMMEETDASLTEIAIDVGMSSLQHFSKLFIDVINMSPSRYRKKFLKK